MPNEPVEPPGKISSETAAPVYEVQLIASARSRPAPLTTAVSAFASSSASAWMGPGFFTSSSHADTTAASPTTVRYETARKVVPEIVLVIGRIPQNETRREVRNTAGAGMCSEM